MSLTKLQDIRETHENQLHFYVIAMKYRHQINNTMLFTITKKIKYLGVSLARHTRF